MASAEEQTVNVRVQQGELRGRRRRTMWGFPYCSFQGIPYAAPPVGPLRFKPPQPAAGWSGVRDATKQGNIAPQMDMTGKYVGEEDCLFINVCTPKLPTEGMCDQLPVMFHVHGGGFFLGSGNEEFGAPDYLIRHGVVFVSINYRLGVLGFLSTGDEVVPGNMGFKDQVMALHWVKDNIASFGGDPDNVTIFGCSAGGISCHAMVLSPLAKGLFRRAISHSGVAAGDGAFSDRARVRRRAFALGAHLGLQTDDSQRLVAFLRTQPAQLLVQSAAFGRTQEDVARSLIIPFAGTVETVDAEGGAFLAEEPARLLRAGEFQQVPFIAGVGTHEGSIFAGDQPPFATDIASFAKNHRLLIPTNLRCPDGDKDALAEQIRRFYFGDRDIGPDTQVQLCTLLGDLLFTYHAVRVAKYHNLKTKAPAYFFVCHHDSGRIPEGPLAELLKKMEKKFDGAGHAGGFSYVCPSKFFSDTAKSGTLEGKLTDQLTRLWTNFAKTGLLSDPEVEVSWPPFTDKDSSYLHITSSGLSIASRPFQDRMAFWEKLYDRYDC